MGHHIMKWAKLNFVARHHDLYYPGHKGHNGVQQKNQLGPFHYVATHMCGVETLRERQQLDASLPEYEPS